MANFGQILSNFVLNTLFYIIFWYNGKKRAKKCWPVFSRTFDRNRPTVPTNGTKKRSKVQYSEFVQKCYNFFVKISCFELWTVFRQFLGTVVKKAKHIKVAPDIYLNFFISLKISVSLSWSLNYVSPKYAFFFTQVKTWTSTWHCLVSGFPSPWLMIEGYFQLNEYILHNFLYNAPLDIWTLNETSLMTFSIQVRLDSMQWIGTNNGTEEIVT